MAEPTGAHPDVVQAHRIELLDRYGRVRALIGELPDSVADGDPIVGVCLLDTEGRRRTFLALDDQGPKLVFDAHGTSVLELGVNDDTPDATKVGPYAFVADAAGRPIVGVRVSPAGELESTLERSA